MTAIDSSSLKLITPSKKGLYNKLLALCHNFNRPIDVDFLSHTFLLHVYIESSHGSFYTSSCETFFSWAAAVSAEHSHRMPSCMSESKCSVQSCGICWIPSCKGDVAAKFYCKSILVLSLSTTLAKSGDTSTCESSANVLVLLYRM